MRARARRAMATRRSVERSAAISSRQTGCEDGSPPTRKPSRFGVLKNDLAGFPNGRRLGDDVVDIAERVAAGVLVPGFNIKPNKQLGDGVDVNDVPYLPYFPYVALPTDGITGLTKRTEPAHAPVPQPPA